MRGDWVWFLGWEDALEKEMATHSSILAWRIPWTEEPGGLQSMGSQRVRHDWATDTHRHTHTDTHTHTELLAYMFLRTKLMCSKWRKEGIQCVYMIKPIRNSLGLYLKDVPWSIYFSPLHGTPLVQATIRSHYCNLFCLCCLSLSLIIQTVARIAFSNIKPLHSFARDSLLTSHYT